MLFIGRTTTSGLVVSALTLATGVALVATRGGACERDDDWFIPHEVWFQGEVQRLSERFLRVGDVTVEIPGDISLLPWPDPALQYRGYISDYVFWDRVETGDLAHIDGTLRKDGTVIAWRIELQDESETTGPPVAGVCDAVGDGTITVGGQVIRIVRDDELADTRIEFANAPIYGPTTYEWMPHLDLNAGHPTTNEEVILPGDAVLVTTVLTDDGQLLASDVTLRMSGDGTVLEGVIRGWDGQTRLLDVDGVAVQFDGSTCVPAASAGRDDFSHLDWVWFGTPEYGQVPPLAGRSARVTGVLRDGVVLADEVRISGRPSDAATARVTAARSRRGRMRLQGVVTDAGAGSIDVNGLRVSTGRGRRVAADAARVPLGSRVRVFARLTPNGVEAVSIERR